MAPTWDGPPAQWRPAGRSNRAYCAGPVTFVGAKCQPSASLTLVELHAKALDFPEIFAPLGQHQSGSSAPVSTSLFGSRLIISRIVCRSLSSAVSDVCGATVAISPANWGNSFRKNSG